jgi:hypothetical protein
VMTELLTRGREEGSNRNPEPHFGGWKLNQTTESLIHN